MAISAVNPAELFSAYMQITRTPTLGSEPDAAPGLEGKTLGLVNGGSWTALWSNYFGRTTLPGVKLVNVGNDAVQLNFMRAHLEGHPVPPPVNIDLFVQYSEQLISLFGADAILITCSTMNRSAEPVRRALKPHGVPLIQIDEPMMEAAVENGGTVLVVATHGPTVKNTQSLLKETAERMGKAIELTGATVETAFDLLGAGDIHSHNEVIANAIREAVASRRIDTVVLAQLSMTVFTFDYPDAVTTFGVPVLTSGQEGFKRIREVLSAR